MILFGAQLLFEVSAPCVEDFLGLGIEPEKW
jgi:hypothetical protein